MDTLPVELLSHIVKFLSLADRREFALVSKKFYEATMDPSLHRNATYHFDAHVLMSDAVDIDPNDSQPFFCKSPNLHIHGLDENLNVKSLLYPQNGISILGPHVLKLSLKGSSILEASFVEIVNRCESLTALDVTGCNSLLMLDSFLTQKERREVCEKVFRGTTELVLSSNRYLSNKTLKTLTGLCPNLDSLSLASCNILFSDYGCMYPSGLTFSSLHTLAIDRASLLTKLDLSRTGVTNSALGQLSSVEDLKLKEILLQNCREISDKGIVELAERQPGLCVVDISGCCELGDGSISALSTWSLNLRELYMAKCQKVTDASAIKIRFLEKLEILDISECYNITVKSIVPIISLSAQLTTFKAHGCNFCNFEKHMGTPMKMAKTMGVQNENGYTRITPANAWEKKNVDPCSMNLLDRFNSLTSLSINSGKYVNDSTIQAVFIHLTNLQCLSLAWCYYITDAGLLGVETNSTNQNLYPQFPLDLDSADFLSTGRYSTSHGRTGFLHSPGSEFVFEELDCSNVESCMEKRGINRLRLLRRLSLSNCPNLRSEGLARIFSNGQFPEMEHLELDLLPRAVTDDLLIQISLSCRLITKLSISSSPVTDVGVQHVVSRLHRLEVLNCSNCDNITAKFFPLLVKNCGWLRSLDLSSCRQISKLSIVKLKKSLPLLTNVQTRYSGGMM